MRPAPGRKLPLPPEWDDAISRYVKDKKASGSPKTSQATYKANLDHMARRIEGGPWEQTRASIRDFFAEQDWATETRRSRLTTLRGFYDWGLMEGFIDHNPAREIKAPRASSPNPKPVPEEIYQMAIATAEPRERLMLRMSRDIGMRRGEVAAARREDLWQANTGEWMINIFGKGSKPRKLPCPADLAYEILRQPPGYLFPGNASGHLSAPWVGRRIGELLQGGYTMHTLRHAFATGLYRRSRDLLMVQKALGHGSPETTRRYVADDDDEQLRGYMEEMSGAHGLRGHAA